MPLDMLKDLRVGAVPDVLRMYRLNAVHATDFTIGNLIGMKPAPRFPGVVEAAGISLDAIPSAQSGALSDTSRLALKAYRRGGELLGNPTIWSLVTDDAGDTFTSADGGAAVLDGMDTEENGGYWLIGSDHKFWGVYLNGLTADPNGTTATLQVDVYTGSGWTGDYDVAGGDLEDNTDSSGATLALNGSLVLSRRSMEKMGKGTFNGNTGYWWRVSVSDAIDVSVSTTDADIISDQGTRMTYAYSEWPLYSFKTTDDGVTYTEYDNGKLALGSLDVVANGDWAVLMHDRPFAGFYWDSGSGNGQGTAALEVSYRTGGAWSTALTTDAGDLTDGTFSTRTLAQDGAVLFDPSICSLMEQDTINSTYGYAVRISTDTLFDDTSVTAAGVYVISVPCMEYLHKLPGNNSMFTGPSAYPVPVTDGILTCVDTISCRSVQANTTVVGYQVDFKYRNDSTAQRSSDHDGTP